jgi:hypothetical protein
MTFEQWWVSYEPEGIFELLYPDLRAAYEAGFNAGNKYGYNIGYHHGVEDTK